MQLQLQLRTSVAIDRFHNLNLTMKPPVFNEVLDYTFKCFIPLLLKSYLKSLKSLKSWNLTVMLTCATYRMPSHYYSPPKYEWKCFFFPSPIKSSLKPIIYPAKEKPPSAKQKDNGPSNPSTKSLKLPPIEKISFKTFYISHH